MRTWFYMLNMDISGIKSIEKEIHIDFFSKTVDKNFSPTKFRIKGIYGENGVGKSAIITAIDVIKNFITQDNYLRDNQNTLLLKKLINQITRKFNFKCEFVTRDKNLLIYTYEVHFDIDDNDDIFVSYESLSYKTNSSKNKSVTLFTSSDGILTTLAAEDNIKSIVEDNTRNLLSKQSGLELIIGSCINANSEKQFLLLLTNALLFFFFTITFFDREDIHEDYCKNINLKNIDKDSLAPEQYKAAIENLIMVTGKRIPIDSFEDYAKRIKRLEGFVRLFKPGLVSIDIDKKIDRNVYVCELIMNYGNYKVDREFESTGIKKIIDLFDAVYAASLGFIAFIDELDSNINDVYLCRLLEYFVFYGKGQLCFTSHNLDPMSVLKDNSKSIDFLTSDNTIVPWVKNGHYTPDNSYRNGMIAGMPFNIDSTDFISVFEGEI